MSRQTTSQNSATTGVILVLVALVVGIFLLAKGGGDHKDTASSTGQSSSSGSKDSNGSAQTTVPVVTTPPAQLEILVGNGSGVAKRAAKTAELLVTAGFTNAKAIEGAKNSDSSKVYFIPGSDDDAKAVAKALGLPEDRATAMPAEVPLNKTKLGTAKILLVVGSDFDPANPTPAAGSGATTTAPSTTAAP